MENRIRQHIEALFASAPNTARARDLREEMIINVIERYHDLVSGGMNESEAYATAVSGIGDVRELIAELLRDPEAQNAAPMSAGTAAPYADSAYRQGNNGGKKGLSTGAIVAISICSAIVLLAIIGACVGLNVIRSMFAGDGFLSNVVDTVSENIEGGMISIGGDDTGFDNAYVDSGSYEVPSQNIREISLEWVNGDVQVLVQPNGDKITFTESSAKAIDEDYALRYSVSDNELKIRFCSTRSWKDIDIIHFNINDAIPRKDIVLNIPASMLTGALEELDISGVAGKTEVTGLSLDSLEVDSTSGNITLSGIVANEISLNNVSGNTLVTDCKAGKLDAETVSGTVTATGGELGAVEADSISGDVEFGFPSMPKSTEVDTVSGSVTVELAEGLGCVAKFSTVSGDFTAPGLSGDEGTYTVGNGGNKLNVSTVSGDLTVTQ